MCGPMRRGAPSSAFLCVRPVSTRMRRRGATSICGAPGFGWKRSCAPDTSFFSSRIAGAAARAALGLTCCTARRASSAGAAGRSSTKRWTRAGSRRPGKRRSSRRLARRRRMTTPWRRRVSCGRCRDPAWRGDRCFFGSSAIRNARAAWPGIAPRRFRPQASTGVERPGSASRSCWIAPARARSLDPRDSRSLSWKPGRDPGRFHRHGPG